MGILSSWRPAMHTIFEILQARDGFDRKDAASLRTAMETALAWCADLLVYAPLLLGREDRPLTWHEATRREWPLRDAMQLLEEAIPPVRYEPLCKLRGQGQCMVCALNRDLFGFECGLGIPEEYKRVQFGGGMALGKVPINQAPPAGLPIGRRRGPERLEEWDT